MKKIFFLLLVLLSVILIMKWQIRSSGSIQNMQGDLSQNSTTGTLHMAFLDIGQGDATFITFPNGEQMLVDCAIDARILEALGRVMPFYDTSLDYLLITHPDKDHYGGCQDVLERFDVANIIYTGAKKENNQSWDSFLTAKTAEGATYHQIEKEDVWHIASTTLHFLYPDHSVEKSTIIPGLQKDTGPNNASIVFILSYHGHTVLMTADTEKELEEYLLKVYSDQLDVDVLKVGHHGSPGSSIQEFVDAVTPLHAIISSGAENSYGHPSPRVVKRLERASSTIWRTDQKGDILVSITPDALYVGTDTFGDQ